MEKLFSLIDTAQQTCGGQKQLAEALGVSPEYVRLLRKGERPVTVEIAGKLALIAGANVQGAVLLALAAHLQKSTMGREVLGALEKGFLALVAAIFVTFATSNDAHGMTQRGSDPNNQLTIPTSYFWRRWLERVRLMVFRTRSRWAWMRGPRPGPMILAA
ncbi:MAG TPA: helix-turn-helix domain-containing protein [Acidimicrobiales bacterium]|nr:helix-turn-helix domain-containing protein [Acidimicrobiales bacterium]